MAEPSLPEGSREPTEDEVLPLMHADERQLYGSADVSAKQKKEIFDFYKEKWKAAHRRERHLAPSIDPRSIDAKYKSFPSFNEWSRSVVDTNRWDTHVQALTAWGDPSPDLLRKARDVVTRAAAIDTGALEHLYEVDRGFTFTIATQAATWEATLDKKGPEVRALIESQMDAYEMVLDFATQKQPMAEAWVRELHNELCKSQETYSALTEIGWQELPLPHGQYKVSPNHVHGRDGEVHAYAPVDRTPAEMQKLMEELRSEEFANGHPVLQASYAHYAFVLIHPFADGNGRVARALASIYTYRAQSIPLLILSENRNSYIDSLTSADRGNFQHFVNFVFERALDAIRLTGESLRAASVPQLSDALEQYKRLYVTRGGYAHEEVDRAGYALVDLISEEVRNQSRILTESKLVEITVQKDHRNDYKLTQPDTTRYPVVESGRMLIVDAAGTVNKQARASIRLFLEVPKDCDIEDEILLSNSDLTMPFSARITELVPEASAALQLRISIFVQAILGTLMRGVTGQARKHLKNQGFIS